MRSGRFTTRTPMASASQANLFRQAEFAPMSTSIAAYSSPQTNGFVQFFKGIFKKGTAIVTNK